MKKFLSNAYLVQHGDCHRALWDLMNALESDQMIEEGKELHHCLEVSWKLVSHYQQCRVHRYERPQREGREHYLFSGTVAERPMMDKLLRDEEQAMETCKQAWNDKHEQISS
jgi:hypothetical protein